MRTNLFISRILIFVFHYIVEHACHVTMATNKFLKRIVAPDIAFEKEQIGDIASQLHNYTHGINSDPLTLLAIVFSALIHDADHRGVSNHQLGTENPDLAEKYHNKSLAEQHSLDQCWALLMEDRFIEMRNYIFSTEDELKRFRQVLVNVVLATDIFDKELNDLRKKRWGKAFSSEDLSDEENNDLRATIVIEHSKYYFSLVPPLSFLAVSSQSHNLSFGIIFLQQSFKLLMCLIPCNIGISTANGTRDSLPKCTLPTVRAAWIRIPASFGTKGKLRAIPLFLTRICRPFYSTIHRHCHFYFSSGRLAFLITMSFPWPRNSRTAMSSEFPVMSASIMPC